MVLKKNESSMRVRPSSDDSRKSS